MSSTDVAAILRQPFPPESINKLPKPNSRDAQKGKCPECGGWHGLPAAHIDYVGHAEVTDRLLTADPTWTWEPVAFGDDGLPLFDKQGGLWIRLTVGGVTRLGYGNATGKTGGDGIKEVIGDAVRNAAMRFGVALDQWAKSDLHLTVDLATGEVAPKAASSTVSRKAPAKTTRPNEAHAATGVTIRSDVTIPEAVANPTASSHRVAGDPWERKPEPSVPVDMEQVPLPDEPQLPSEPGTSIPKQGWEIAAKRRKAMYAMLNELVGSDRDKMLQLVSGIMGRPVEASAELSDAEVQVVCESLRAKIGATK